jgi:hypothetical protein
MAAIRSWKDIKTSERVKCIEQDDSMDDGRFWVVYARGWVHRSYRTHTKSAGSFAEARSAVTDAVPCDCEQCRQ